MSTPVPSEDLIAQRTTAAAPVQTGAAAPPDGASDAPRVSRRRPIAIHCDCED